MSCSWSGDEWTVACPKSQCGRVKAKLGRKTKVCLPVALEKAMCATMRSTSLGCMGLVARSVFFPAGLRAGKGALGCGTALDMLCQEMHEAWWLGDASKRPAVTARKAFSHRGRAVTAKERVVVRGNNK